MSLARPLPLKLLALLGAILSLAFGLQWILGTYIAMQHAAELKLELNSNVSLTNIQLVNGRNDGAGPLLRFAVDDLAGHAGEDRMIVGYAPSGPLTPVAQLILTADSVLPTEWPFGTAGALVHATLRVAGPALPSDAALRTVSLTPAAPGRTMASRGLVFAACVSALLSLLCATQASRNSQQRRRVQTLAARPRTPHDLRTARRFAALEAQENLNGNLPRSTVRS